MHATSIESRARADASTDAPNAVLPAAEKKLSLAPGPSGRAVVSPAPVVGSERRKEGLVGSIPNGERRSIPMEKGRRFQTTVRTTDECTAVGTPRTSASKRDCSQQRHVLLGRDIMETSTC